MSYQLIRRDGEFPPQGFIYTDPRTGMKFDGIGFSRTVEEIIKHRRANANVYSPSDGKWLDTDEVGRELSLATCFRIGNNPRFCREFDNVPFKTNASNEIRTMPKPCPNCGEIQGRVKFCSTCSGSVIKGFYCVKCNHLQSK